MDAHPSVPGGRALRTTALYVILVGVPALGVAATLHIGRDLKAPPSVGGAWGVESVAGGCNRAEGTLTIQQSGARIDAVYTPVGASPVAVRGRVHEDVAVLGDAGSCEYVEIAAGRDPARPDTLEATLQTGVCGCRTTAATLVRAEAEPLSGGH